MITVGVDLAAEPVNTAVAILTWSPAGCVVTDLTSPATDDEIVNCCAGATKVGIDCPLGWPDDFIDFVVAHRNGNVTPPADVEGKAWRRTLANRLTDTVIHDEFGMTPLSVSTDRIAHPAMRAAGLLTRLGDGEVLDRSGNGLVVEAYPAGSLRVWGMTSRGYKGKDSTAILGTIVEELLGRAPWLDLGGFAAICRSSDHAFDAVLAGLTARAAALGQTREPSAAEREQAAREGWVAVPLKQLEDLDPTTQR